MSRALESKTGVDGPVTVIKNYAVPSAEAAEVRFVHVADWNSGTALDKATANPEWRASLQRMFDDPGLHITSEPAAFRVAVELDPA